MKHRVGYLFRVLFSAVLGLLAVTEARAAVLSLDERIHARKAVEEVLWRNRIWPDVNPEPKPALASVLPDESIRATVLDALRKSNALETYWNQPITAAELQAELDRWISATHDPKLLRELYRALGDDPTLIAEILARPRLADRKLRALFADDAGFDAWWTKHVGEFGTGVPTTDGPYRLAMPETGGCVNDTWHEYPPGPNAPVGSSNGVWTGVEMIVFGTGATRPGGRYEPATDTWQPIPASSNSLFDDRGNYTAVWTGTEMIIWGGDWFFQGSHSLLNDGVRYKPATNSWQAVSVGANVPSARYHHTAVWTGTRMIVWGGLAGFTPSAPRLNTGGAYDPTTNSWSPTSTAAGVPSGRYGHTAVWSGSVMIVWGGFDFAYLSSGGRYDPGTDSWSATNPGGPSARTSHTALWTGSTMIVWGGSDAATKLNTGGRYDPAADSWQATSTAGAAPSARTGHSAVWTGSQMIVWGGNGGGNLNTGGRYDPLTNFWSATSTGQDVPSARQGHGGYWTGTEMIIWRGSAPTASVSRYCAAAPCALPTDSYVDADGDTYGDPQRAVLTCNGSVPPGCVVRAGDCADSNTAIHPGVAEVCNGLDDDCNTLVDDGVAAPGGTPVLSASSVNQFEWTPLAGAGTYDAVTGTLSSLLLTGGDYSQGVAGCPQNDTAATSMPGGPSPASGEGFWYLVRGANCGGNGSYDSGSPEQVGSRDWGIALSPNACP